jgi:voltage-gated potassium channel
MENRILRRVVLLACLLLFTLAAGTLGFRIVEGYPWFDAFYMTLITVTTVGYQEVHPLSHAGRLFNSALILFGVSAVFFGVGAMTQTIIEMELHDRFGKRRTRRAIMKLRDHFVICGFGRVGRNAALELRKTGEPFVVIDRNEQRVARATEAGMTAIVADATRDDTLREAGIERARGFVAALATDADNVFVILTARNLNPELTIVTRASEDESEAKLRRAGADIVFSPYSMAGQKLAQSLVRPHVVQFLDFAAESMGLDVMIEQFRVNEQATVVSRTLRELMLRNHTGVMVLAVRKPDGKMVFNPPAETRIAAGDFLIAMGRQSDLRAFDELLAGRAAAREMPAAPEPKV